MISSRAPTTLTPAASALTPAASALAPAASEKYFQTEKFKFKVKANRLKLAYSFD